MAYVDAYLRANEFQKQYNRPCPLRQDILQRKGTLREVLQWYLSHDGLGVFCSTETSPGTPATEQVTREVAAGVEAGLAQAWSWHHDKPATKLFARRIAARRSRQEHTAASQ
jgi:hypothetical protein